MPAHEGARGLDPRVDCYPTHEHQGYRFRVGKVFPFGATLVPGGVNFSTFSRHASGCTLVLFEKGACSPLVEIPFPDSFRIGNVWSMIVFGLDAETIEYGYRMDGPWDPAAGHRFDPNRILLDPYAKCIGGRNVWGQQPDPQNPFPYRGRLAFEDFDWEGDRPLEIPMQDLIIYEMHVRGFTRHRSSGVRHPGSFAGLREKIPHLKHLGVNCVELMPVYEFDEFANSRANPFTNQPLLDYWGYSTVGFFAPKAGFAASGHLGMQVDELKTLIKDLHTSGIEVLLDVVFNHTAERGEDGPTISFRGIDNRTYYMLTPDGAYLNFSGCGNTLNCNNPVVRSLVVDCLRYWAAEFHIDGFRFDLASILGRDADGAPLLNPPLIEALAYDPVLGRCKLIAEAWDAGGLYQVGSFPAFGRWAEWNGKYRDDVRRFLKGDEGMTRGVAARVLGSPDLYGASFLGPTASINFITCHDGFTLRDLFSYSAKHNEANGEDNLDGSGDNHSWNCGCEGETADAGIRSLRRRLMKNAWIALMVSHGVPMFPMGDEMGRTLLGNNNAYCQDSELNWLDWRLVNDEPDLLRFARLAIALRKAHPVLRPRRHFQGKDWDRTGLPDISWHGTKAWQPDFSPSSRSLAFLLDGRYARTGSSPDDLLYVAFNSYWEPLEFILPELPLDYSWRISVNTSMPSPNDIFAPGTEPPADDNGRAVVGGRSVVVMIGTPGR